MKLEAGMTITFDLPKFGITTITILSVKGDRIRYRVDAYEDTIHIADLDALKQHIVWYGRHDTW